MSPRRSNHGCLAAWDAALLYAAGVVLVLALAWIAVADRAAQWVEHMGRSEGP